MNPRAKAGASSTHSQCSACPEDRSLSVVGLAKVSQHLDVGGFYVYGHAYKELGGTSWEVFSDRRLKRDMRPFEPGLNEILHLRPVRFRYLDDAKRGLTSDHEEVGFIAQEVREVIPDAVAEDKDGYLTLKADPIHWAGINAIQELNAKVEAQRADSTAKDARIAALERSVAELKELVGVLAQSNGGAR